MGSGSNKAGSGNLASGKRAVGGHCPGVPIAEPEPHSACRTRMLPGGGAWLVECLPSLHEARHCVNLAWGAHICNHSTAELKAGGSEFQGCP